MRKSYGISREVVWESAGNSIGTNGEEVRNLRGIRRDFLGICTELKRELVGGITGEFV